MHFSPPHPRARLRKINDCVLWRSVTRTHAFGRRAAVAAGGRSHHKTATITNRWQSSARSNVQTGKANYVFSWLRRELCMWEIFDFFFSVELKFCLLIGWGKCARRLVVFESCVVAVKREKNRDYFHNKHVVGCFMRSPSWQRCFCGHIHAIVVCWKQQKKEKINKSETNKRRRRHSAHALLFSSSEPIDVTWALAHLLLR